MVDQEQDQVTDAEIEDPERYLPVRGSGVKIRGKGNTHRHTPIRLLRKRIRIDKADIATILVYLRRGAHLDTAFAMSGIQGQTYRYWIARGREALGKLDHGEELSAYDRKLIKLFAQVEQAQAQCETRLVGVIADAAHAGSWSAALSLLERRFPDHWSKREEKDLSINVSAGFQFVQVMAGAAQHQPSDARSDDQAPGTPISEDHQLTPGTPPDMV